MALHIDGLEQFSDGNHTQEVSAQCPTSLATTARISNKVQEQAFRTVKPPNWFVGRITQAEKFSSEEVVCQLKI